MTRDELIKQCVDRFLAWRLPDTVNPDPCTRKDSGYREKFPNTMSGTSLLTADEAQQMFQYVLKDVPNEPAYILIFERYGDREGHHYIGGLYSDLAMAVIEGLEHELFRANKYELRLEIAYLDSGEPNKEVPREVAINLAKLKFPDRFDSNGQLKDEVTPAGSEGEKK